MYLTPEAIEYCKNELQIHNDFEPADIVTANHVIYKQWVEKTGRANLPKMIFYILMDEVYGMSYLKDKDGSLGRPLKVKDESY